MVTSTQDDVEDVRSTTGDDDVRTPAGNPVDDGGSVAVVSGDAADAVDTVATADSADVVEDDAPDDDLPDNAPARVDARGAAPETGEETADAATDHVAVGAHAASVDAERSAPMAALEFIAAVTPEDIAADAVDAAESVESTESAGAVELTEPAEPSESSAPDASVVSVRAEEPERAPEPDVPDVLSPQEDAGALRSAVPTAASAPAEVRTADADPGTETTDVVTRGTGTVVDVASPVLSGAGARQDADVVEESTAAIGPQVEPDGSDSAVRTDDAVTGIPAVPQDPVPSVEELTEPTDSPESVEEPVARETSGPAVEPIDIAESAEPVDTIASADEDSVASESDEEDLDDTPPAEPKEPAEAGQAADVAEAPEASGSEEAGEPVGAPVAAVPESDGEAEPVVDFVPEPPGVHEPVESAAPIEVSEAGEAVDVAEAPEASGFAEPNEPERTAEPESSPKLAEAVEPSVATTPPSAASPSESVAAATPQRDEDPGSAAVPSLASGRPESPEPPESTPTAAPASPGTLASPERPRSARHALPATPDTPIERDDRIRATRAGRHRHVTEPDAPGSASSPRTPARGVGRSGRPESDAVLGGANASGAAAVADRKKPSGSGAAGVEDAADTEEPASPDLPPSYPPTHRPRPLPVPGDRGEDDAEDETVEQPSRMRRALSNLVFVVVVVAVVALIKTFAFQTYTIPSGSMENTLYDRDRIVVRVYDLDDVDRGDIVVFTDPDHWLQDEEPTGLAKAWRDTMVFMHLLPEGSGHHLVKRVVGTAGDRVVADGRGNLTVNGVAVEEPYLKPGVAPSSVPFDVVVPEDCVWVMGDNRSNSLDSRFHRDDPHGGAVPVSDIVGVAKGIYWPTGHWGSLEGGESAFADIPAPGAKKG